MNSMTDNDVETTGTDEALLSAYVERDDQAAFVEIYRKYAGLVYSVSHRFVRSDADAEDVAAACFAVLARKATILKGKNIAGWLYGRAMGMAGHMMTSRRRRAAREQEAAEMNTDTQRGNEETERLLCVVEKEIARLPERQREAIVLQYYQGLSGAEIAAAMHCARGAVAVLVHRGMEKLRARLARLGMGDLDVESSLSSSALLLPVPAGMWMKLSGVLSGQIAGGPVAELVKGAIQEMLLAKMKVAALAAAVVCGVAVPAVVATWMLSGTPSRESKAVTTAAATKSESQVEVIYEDHFDGAKLSDFWETVEPTNQVTLGDPSHKSALVLRASGTKAWQKLKPEAVLISRGIDATRDIVEIILTERRPDVRADKIGEYAVFNGMNLCDDGGKNLLAKPYLGNRTPVGKPHSKVIVMSENYAVSVSKFYLFSNGDALVLGEDASFWGWLKDKPKSVRLKISLEISDPTAYATWPVEELTVRRLRSLPPDVAKMLAGIRAGTSTLEVAEAKEDSPVQKK